MRKKKKSRSSSSSSSDEEAEGTSKQKRRKKAKKDEPNSEEDDEDKLKKKKKRKKTEKQALDEEHQQTVEDAARRSEAESSEAKRFLVGMPLASVGGLSGGSVCRNFRKRDLALNDILPVPLESLLSFVPAKSLYESLKGPIYFVCFLLLFVCVFTDTYAARILRTKHR